MSVSFLKLGEVSANLEVVLYIGDLYLDCVLNDFRRSAGCESLGSSQVFSEHVFKPGHACSLLNSPEKERAFQSTYSPKYLLPQSLPS